MKHSPTKKIVFLDRDGVINKKAADHHYITSWKDFIFNEGIFNICNFLKGQGFEFIVITNQRGVARQLVSQEILEDIHEQMVTEFEKRDIKILDVFYCPHDYGECTCRKPFPGMLEKATEKYSINKELSILISDSHEDITMGQDFGVGENIFVHSDKPEEAFSFFKKIKIAFVKYGGLTSGGSEKMLQIIAAHLPKERFDVTYFYCDPSPYRGGQAPQGKTDPFRYEYMKQAGVRLVKFSVKEKDITTPTHIWRGTNFFEVFNEDDFDIIQTCRSGHKEYPFTHIRKKPIVDIIALSSGSDNQYNISRVLQISSWSAINWVTRGGDKKRVSIISLPIDIKEKNNDSFRYEFNVENHFVFGMHQRKDNSIFSPIPLEAYKMIEDDTTVFILLGGGDRYKKQAEELSIKNIFFIEQSGDSEVIHKFLRTLDVFTHGRKDGEVNSQAMAEAMYFRLPIVSHISSINNGHVECVRDAGVVVTTVNEYAKEMRKLSTNKEYYNYRSKNSKKNFKENYELNGQIKNMATIYEEVYNNPFPNKIYRILMSLHYTQNLRLLAVYLYLKFKNLLV